MVRHVSKKRSKSSFARRNYVKAKSECLAICKEVVDDIFNIIAKRIDENKNIQSTADEYDFPSFISETEKLETELFELEIEKIPDPNRIDGYRVVEINYFLKKALTLQVEHNKLCTGGHLEFETEKRNGLVSEFIFKCNSCEKRLPIASENPFKNKQKLPSVINKAAVWGTLSAGSTYTHMSEFLSVLNVPTMSSRMYHKIQDDLGNVYENTLWEEMELAGREEYKLAVESQNVDADGIPYITVNLDGGWSKRSYGHSYNAMSGAAVIIGQKTGKVLFVGVRNKYCSICAKAENKSLEAPAHTCFKNHTGSSTSMECDIIVEGFKSSISMHNLRYKRIIADGDSSVYSKIQKEVDYGYQVDKIECVNHCIKNYGKKLYKFKKDVQNVSLSARKLLTAKSIEELTKSVKQVIYFNKATGDVEKLKNDLTNTVDCVFGNHMQCNGNICKLAGTINKDRHDSLIKSGAHYKIHSALSNVIGKARQLINNETNNKSETFMNILARFNMGKRLNLIQRGGFKHRTYLTALRYNKGHLWHEAAWKKCFNRKPDRIMQRYITAQNTIQKKRKLKEQENGQVKKRKRVQTAADDINEKDYGPNMIEINLSSKELEVERNNLLKRLQVTEERQKEIAIQTVGQFENSLYRTERLNRLTASNFGAVIKRRSTTSCHSLVSKILKPSTCMTPAMSYGKDNEQVAISLFSELTQKKVEKAGLYVDTKYGYLGASPDGIINQSEIVEVKCLFKVSNRGISLEEAVRGNEVNCMTVKTDNNIGLKNTHDYYYQIQGQLAITKATTCHFIVFTGDKNALFVEEIAFDPKLWEEVMLPKLTDFYMNCLAPNIIEDRPTKGRCKDPPSILKAQESAQAKKRRE